MLFVLSIVELCSYPVGEDCGGAAQVIAAVPTTASLGSQPVKHQRIFRLLWGRPPRNLPERSGVAWGNIENATNAEKTRGSSQESTVDWSVPTGLQYFAKH